MMMILMIIMIMMMMMIIRYTLLDGYLTILSAAIAAGLSGNPTMIMMMIIL
jgi:hypothetical protein